MLFRPIRWALSLASTAVLLYFFFLVPIGKRTLYQHFRRIAGTPEAQDLGHDLGQAGERALQKAQTEMHTPFALPTDGADAAVGADASHLHRQRYLQ